MLNAKWYRDVIRERKARVKDIEKNIGYSQDNIEFWKHQVELEKQWLLEATAALEQAIEWEKEYKAQNKK